MGKEENVQGHNQVLSPQSAPPVAVGSSHQPESGNAVLAVCLLDHCFICFVILEVSLQRWFSVWEGIRAPPPNSGHCLGTFLIVPTGEEEGVVGIALAEGCC